MFNWDWDTLSGWSVGAGGRFWPILATRGPFKDQFIYLIKCRNCTYSLIYILVPVETSSGQDGPKTSSRSNPPAVPSIVDPFKSRIFAIELFP